MSAPGNPLVRRLLELASGATCQRDQRAALVVTSDGRVRSGGTNGLPDGAPCGDICTQLKTCKYAAEHAEAAAIRRSLKVGVSIKGDDIIHAATSTNGQLVTSRPPTEKACPSCAVAMVAAGIAAIWLFVEPGEWRRYEMREYYQQAIGYEQLRRSRE